MKNATGTTEAKPVNRRPVWRFIVMLAVWIALFYAATATPWFRTSAFPTYLEWNARAAGAVLNLLGERVSVTGPTIVSAKHLMSILRGCDAIEPTALFIAGVLAFPASLRRKALAVLIGVPLLAALNLVRIVSLYYVGIHAPEMFEVIHVDVWQTAFVFIVMLLWMVWAWRVTATPRAASVSEGEKT